MQDGEEASGKQSTPTAASQVDDPGSSAVRGDRFCINAKVIVYAALSGMISFLPDGTIYGCNHHFAVMLFGYSQEELLKKVRVVTPLKWFGNGRQITKLFGEGRQTFLCSSVMCSDSQDVIKIPV